MNQEMFIVTEIQRTSRGADSPARLPQPEKPALLAAGRDLLRRCWTWLLAPWEEVNTPGVCGEANCA